jgi:hypothetical protein
MRLLCAFVLASSLSVLPLALGGDNALAVLACGMFDGKFQCKAAPGGGPHGKNADTGGSTETPQSSPEGVTGGQGTTETNTGQTPDGTTACQHGMVGTPPNDCRCPPNSELLGGNCVHYTATCSNGLAANVNPQPCQGAEEKLACKMRDDGLKDCCCLTYDKF